MLVDTPHLRLAGVTTLGVAGQRGPRTAYLFDPHRLALPCWALALEEGGFTEPATLVTLDRHFDLVVPRDVPAIPDRSAGLRALDEHARWSLDVRNFDHIVAAMEAGLVGDVVAIARARPRESLAVDTYTDRTGGLHEVLRRSTVARAAEGWELDADPVRELLERDGPILLDVDLDCFTSPSDADPTTVLPWPRDVLRDFLVGAETKPFWDAVLPRAICLTLAREPHHCGGVLAGDRLFAQLAEVLFGELLGADVP